MNGTRLTRVLLAVDDHQNIDLIASALSKDSSISLKSVDHKTSSASLAAAGYDLCVLALPPSYEQAYEFLRHAQSLPAPVPIILIAPVAEHDWCLAATADGFADCMHRDELSGNLLTRSIRYATERQQAAVALQAAMRRFNILIEHSSDAFILLDKQGNIMSVGPSSGRLVGYGEAELLGRSQFQLLHQDDLQVVRSRFDALAERPGAVEEVECRVAHKDGSWKWLECVATNLLDEADIGAIVLNCHDITERKAHEAEIRQLNEQLSRQLERTTALHQIDLAITGSFDVRVALNILLNEVTNQLGVDAAAVLLLNTQTWIMEHMVSRGFHTDAIRRQRTQVMKSLAGRAVIERCTLHMGNLGEAGADAALGPGLSNERFSSYWVTPLISKGQVKGILEVYNRLPLQVDDEWLDFLATLANQAAIAIDNAVIFEDMRRVNLELERAYNTTIEGWARVLDRRDGEIEGSSRLRADRVLSLGHALGLGEEELRHIRHGALLHDVGHMGIPEQILLKTEPLSEAERGQLELHPHFAYEFLSPIPFLRPALDIPYCHQERWDGSGYPRGLQGEQIPRAARLFAPIDVWQALVANRPYRAAWSHEKALAYLVEQSGLLFDPDVIEILLPLARDW